MNQIFLLNISKLSLLKMVVEAGFGCRIRIVVVVMRLAYRWTMVVFRYVSRIKFR